MPSVDRIQGLSGQQAIKTPCRLATTANITLSGEQTIDGVAAIEGDRVLVKDQTDTTANGIYDVSTGSWTRSLDFDGANDIADGTLVLVGSGGTNADLVFKLNATEPIEIDTTALTFSVSAVFTAISVFGATLLDDANAAAARTTLGLGTAAVEAASAFQPADEQLTELAAIVPAQGDIIYHNGTDWVKLAAGTSGHFLKTLGTGANPAWSSLPAGSNVQVVDATPYTTYGNSAATTIPYDDTIPQDSEGTQWNTVTITPTSATNKLRIEVDFDQVLMGASETTTVALFNSASANAVASVAVSNSSGTAALTVPIHLTHTVVAGGTSAITFNVRAAGNGSTIYINGTNAARRLGGISAVRMCVTEIKV